MKKKYKNSGIICGNRKRRGMTKGILKFFHVAQFIDMTASAHNTVSWLIFFLLCEYLLYNIECTKLSLM